jgi:hypothetical protein
MDEEAVRAALQHSFDYSATDEDVAHESYHEDAVLEFPQSGGPLRYGVDILEFRGDEVSRESVYSMEAWEAPGWRARWRAAPPSQPEGEPASDPAADAGGA